MLKHKTIMHDRLDEGIFGCVSMAEVTIFWLDGDLESVGLRRIVSYLPILETIQGYCTTQAPKGCELCQTPPILSFSPFMNRHYC